MDKNNSIEHYERLLAKTLAENRDATEALAARFAMENKELRERTMPAIEALLHLLFDKVAAMRDELEMTKQSAGKHIGSAGRFAKALCAIEDVLEGKDAGEACQHHNITDAGDEELVGRVYRYKSKAKRARRAKKRSRRR